MAEYYNKPTALTKFINSTLRQFASIGLSPRDTVALQVRGRKSGKTRSNVVTYVEHEGARYLVAPRGSTEWVRNARAAGGQASLKHGRSQPVRLIDVPESERAPIIRAYLQKMPGMVRREFGVEADSPAADIERIAPRHPVFRIVGAVASAGS
jgi:deazaflavin-dependent oxidoreductase (nitroreductase family)